MTATIAHTLCTLVFSLGMAVQVHRSVLSRIPDEDGGGIPQNQACSVTAPSGAPTAVATVTMEPVAAADVRTLRITAYCDRGLTAAGVPSGVGQCAAPGDVPLGSRVYIPELNRTLIVTDRTHKRFRHNTIDIFIPDRQACLQFGVKRLTCIITPPAEPHRYGSTTILAQIAAHES